MILNALVKYYEQLAEKGDISVPGWCEAKVSAGLDITLEGELAGIIPLKIKETRGKKTIEQPQKMTVPEQVTRSSGVSPNFLCDNSSYILGIDEKGKPERARNCFAAAKEKHLQLLKDVHSDAAEAVKKFFEKWSPEEAKQNAIIKEHYEELCSASNLIFSLNGEYVQDDREIKQAWENCYASEEEPDGTCLVTGKRSKIARIHGLIKGIPGAQSSGASLVGFNAPSFQSYDKEQSYNAPVSEYAVYAYTTALNYLINAKQGDHYKFRTVIGDTVIVYWSEDGEEIYQNTFAALIEPNADNQEIVSGVFRNLERGWAVDVDSILNSISTEQRFYVLGLTPNAARIAVSFFYQDSFGNLLKHLKAHYQRMEIVRYEKDPVKYLGTWRMMQEIVNKKSKDKKPPANIAGATLQAIISGGRYPEALYQAVIRRIRAEQDDSDSQIYKITRGRAEIIKAFLLRNTQVSEKEEITVALNENNKSVPYILGRMFAVLECVQEDANPSINATIKDRYFNAACEAPASIFPILLKLANSHLKKINRDNKGYYIRYEKMIGTLQENILVTEDQTLAYPKRISLEEQGMFILGYYQQRRDLFRKKEKEDK